MHEQIFVFSLKKQFSALVIIIILLLVSLNFAMHTTGQASDSDFIITDAKIITMEPDGFSYTSLVVEGETISDVTNDSLIEKLNDDLIKKIYLGGRTVLPGFIDSHSHWIGDRDRVGLTADEVIKLALSYGWTSISEQFVNQDRLDELIQLDSEDRLKLRVNAFLPVNYQEQRFGDWYQAYLPHEMMSDKVRIGGVKFFMDNGPYFSNVGRNHWFTAEELNPMVKTVHDLGYQISIHSFIDNATDTALNAIAAAQGDNSNSQYRHRIEHASFLRDDQLIRLDEMNVIISAQLLWHSDDWAEQIIVDAEADPTPDLHLLVARWRDVIDQGVTFIGSTDTPWGVPDELGSSMIGLYTVTTRRGENGTIPPQWMLDQRITVEEALKSITIDAAWGAFEEDIKGSIKIGKLADFVVLSENPLETLPEDLLEITVDMTIVGGEVVFCAKGLEVMCDGEFTGSITSSSSTTSTPLSLSLYFPYLLIPVIVKSRKKIKM